MQPSGSSASNKSTKPKKWLPWVIVVLCFLPGAFVTSYLYISEAVNERHNRIQFDSEGWKSAKPDGIRLRMVDGLIGSHKLDGKTREEVINLLGDTTGERFANDVKKRFPDWQMHYYLGPTRQNFLFRGLDYDYLVLRLDKQGKVVSVDIVTLTT